MFTIHKTAKVVPAPNWVLQKYPWGVGVFGLCHPGLQIWLKRICTKMIPSSRNKLIFNTLFEKMNHIHNLTMCNTGCNSLLVNILNYIFKSILSLNNFEWLLTKHDLLVSVHLKYYTAFWKMSVKRIPHFKSEFPKL